MGLRHMVFSSVFLCSNRASYREGEHNKHVGWGLLVLVAALKEPDTMSHHNKHVGRGLLVRSQL